MLGSSVDLTNHFPKRITGVIFELQVVMMGNPAEAGAMGGAGSYPSQQQQPRQQARTIGYPNVSYYKNKSIYLIAEGDLPRSDGDGGRDRPDRGHHLGGGPALGVLQPGRGRLLPVG